MFYQFTFEELPLDAILKVFDYLEVGKVIDLKRVNKEYKDILFVRFCKFTRRKIFKRLNDPEILTKNIAMID
jgi:hypothetical protein